ncbi:MAG TPA: hypothetical protein PKD52_01090 [Clostridiales bacterium]|nr:hypothetical protein [Clostridiales bacterium]
MSNTIAQSLTALSTAKSNIAAAITNKGGTVQSGDGFADFAAAIATLPTGLPLPPGLTEMKSGSFKPGSDTICSGYSIPHLLAAAPKFFYLWIQGIGLSAGSKNYINNIVIYNATSMNEDFNQTTLLEGGKILTVGKTTGFADVEYTRYLSTSSTRITSILGASAVQFSDVSYYFKANVTYYWIALR